MTPPNETGETGRGLPVLGALNMPAHLLAALLALHEAGVPPSDVRFVPRPNRLAAPEVMLDPETRGVGRPVRLAVNVRADTVTRFLPSPPDADPEAEAVVEERTVGRLAHFAPPLSVFAEDDGAGDADPLARLCRQVGRIYPELTDTVASDVAQSLDRLLAALDAALGAASPGAAEAHAVADAPGRSADPGACRTAWALLWERLRRRDPAGVCRAEEGGADAWPEALFAPDHALRVQVVRQLLGARSPGERRAEREGWLSALRALLAEEDRADREAVVREMLEWISTEAFTAAALCDLRWGITFVHGPADAFAPEDRRPAQGVSRARLGSRVGGTDAPGLMAAAMDAWSRGPGGFLGVCASDPIAAWTREEMRELWSLAARRRAVADPCALLEQALRRLVHTEASAALRRHAPAPTRLGTLSAQPTATAVLGGGAALLFPTIEVRLPLAEDGSGAADRTRARADGLVHVFAPATTAIRFLWRETTARLGSACLRHPFQTGARLAPPTAAKP